MGKIKKIFFLYLIFSISTFPQTSLYNGNNLYSKNFQTGDMVKIHINNNFSVNFTGDWNQNFEATLKYKPDQQNLSFLKPSEQTKNNQRKQKEKQTTIERLSFDLTGNITKMDDGRLRINATRIIELDGKTTHLNCTGILNERKIITDMIHSDDIADLNLVIVTKPDVQRDITISPDNRPEVGINAVEPSKILTEEEIKKYVIRYLQEILGGLQ